MYSNAMKRVATLLGSYTPWTNVYGLARTVIALCTAATLAANDKSVLFRPGAGSLMPPFCQGTRAVSAFCITPTLGVDAIRWICIAILLVVASGWRPRVTCLFHWWVSFSLQASALVVDGGDQVAAVLTLLLIPIALADDRAWHWSEPTTPVMNGNGLHRKLLAAFGHGLLRLQVAGIYFHASVAKLTVPEWKDGTAMYYWGTHESFGAPAWLIPFFRPIVVHGFSVTALTWSVIVLELALSVAFLMERRYQRLLMLVGMTMHFGIVFVHGLPSFGLTMVATLLVYLQPLSVELLWLRRLSNRFTKTRIFLNTAAGQRSCGDGLAAGFDRPVRDT